MFANPFSPSGLTGSYQQPTLAAGPARARKVPDMQLAEANLFLLLVGRLGRTDGLSPTPREQEPAAVSTIAQPTYLGETTELCGYMANIYSLFWMVEKQLELIPRESGRERSWELQQREQLVRAAAMLAEAPQLTRCTRESSLAATIRREAATRLLESWLSEDREAETGTWEHLKAELDRDRISGRKLFP